MPEHFLPCRNKRDSRCLPHLCGFYGLPEILDVLRGIDADHLSHPIVAGLFPVQDRRARQMVARRALFVRLDPNAANRSDSKSGHCHINRIYSTIVVTGL